MSRLRRRVESRPPSVEDPLASNVYGLPGPTIFVFPDTATWIIGGVTSRSDPVSWIVGSSMFDPVGVFGTDATRIKYVALGHVARRERGRIGVRIAAPEAARELAVVRGADDRHHGLILVDRRGLEDDREHAGLGHDDRVPHRVEARGAQAAGNGALTSSMGVIAAWASRPSSRRRRGRRDRPEHTARQVRRRDRSGRPSCRSAAPPRTPTPAAAPPTRPRRARGTNDAHAPSVQ